ncbi:type II toxin-antitoxin system RelE/ParE family toxin [Peijinzhouia sedimentorum]
MELKVIWSEFAEIQLDEIFDFYKKEASLRVANKLVREIIFDSESLSDNPFIGQIEFRLENRKFEYRYLLCKHYKIIYSVSIEQGLIKIADVFDTRQYPPKIGREK